MGGAEFSLPMLQNQKDSSPHFGKERGTSATNTDSLEGGLQPEGKEPESPCQAEPIHADSRHSSFSFFIGFWSVRISVPYKTEIAGKNASKATLKNQLNLTPKAV
jgi:hypothetical protein